MPFTSFNTANKISSDNIFIKHNYGLLLLAEPTCDYCSTLVMINGLACGHLVHQYSLHALY